MSRSPDPNGIVANLAERATDGATLVTLGMGGALTLAPQSTAPAIGLGGTAAGARLLGLVDVALGVALVALRPRWPWMMGRALLNVVIVGRYRAAARAEPGSRRARLGAAGMAALTVFDGAVALTLRQHHR